MTAPEIAELVTAAVALLTALTAFIRARVAHKAAAAAARRPPGVATSSARRSVERKVDGGD